MTMQSTPAAFSRSVTLIFSLLIITIFKLHAAVQYSSPNAAITILFMVEFHFLSKSKFTKSHLETDLTVVNFVTLLQNIVYKCYA